MNIERIRGVFCDDALYKLTFTLTFTLQSGTVTFTCEHYVTFGHL